MKLIDSTPRSPFQKLNISDTSIRTVSTAASSASESGGHGGRGRKLSLLSRFRGQNSKKGLPKSKPELSKQTSSGTFSFSSSFSFPSKQESSVELTKQELVESSYNRQDEESILSCYLEEDDSIASASSSSSSSSAWARAPDDDEGTVVEKLEAALADDDGTVISSSRMSVNFSEISHTQQQQQQHSSKNSGSPTPRIITTQSQESSATKQKEFQKQRLFWQNAAMKRSVLYGSKHVKTAETLLDLGNAQMACEVCEGTQTNNSSSSTGSVHVVYYPISTTWFLTNLFCVSCVLFRNTSRQEKHSCRLSKLSCPPTAINICRLPSLSISSEWQPVRPMPTWD
jgi:hypothetical protein